MGVDGVQILIDDARTAGFSMVGERSLLKFRARSLRQIPVYNNSEPTETIRYDLTNLEFTGIDITTRRKGDRILSTLDKLTFLFEDYSCELQQLEDYDSVIQRLRDTGGSAATSTLTVLLPSLGDRLETNGRQGTRTVEK
jgi:hypothetical protein